jgi:hypothetical protein
MLPKSKQWKDKRMAKLRKLSAASDGNGDYDIEGIPMADKLPWIVETSPDDDSFSATTIARFYLESDARLAVIYLSEFWEALRVRRDA